VLRSAAEAALARRRPHVRVCLALNARSHASLGHRPGFRSDDGPALKARFNAPVRRQSHPDWCRNESPGGCRAGRLALHESLGALPQAGYERRAFGAKQMLRTSHSSRIEGRANISIEDVQFPARQSRFGGGAKHAPPSLDEKKTSPGRDGRSALCLRASQSRYSLLSSLRGTSVVGNARPPALKRWAIVSKAMDDAGVCRWACSNLVGTARCAVRTAWLGPYATVRTPNRFDTHRTPQRGVPTSHVRAQPTGGRSARWKAPPPSCSGSES
jgi:hypothetical protein